jgi:hypothetical protein
MAFTDLEAYPDLMREENYTEIGSKSDSDLIDLKRESSLIELKSSLCTQLLLNEETTDILDALADKYENILNRALTYKQLEIYYFNERSEPDDKASTGFEYYLGKYKELEKRFKDFEVDEITDDKITNGRFTSYSLR